MGSHQSSSSGRPDGHSLFCPSAPLQERGMRRRGTQATPMITAVPSANRQTVHRSHSLAHFPPRIDRDSGLIYQDHSQSGAGGYPHPSGGAVHRVCAVHAPTPCASTACASTASAPCMRRLRRACAHVQCNPRDLCAPRAAHRAQLAPCTGLGSARPRSQRSLPCPP